MKWKLYFMIGAKTMNAKKNKISVRSITKKAGFSLIEVLVSVMIFVVIIMSSTEIFGLVINGQRDAIASQNVQESLKYFFEVIGKEMRMAVVNDGSCSGSGFQVGKIFVISSSGLDESLHFKNYYGECVTYEIVADGDSQRFRVTRNSNVGFISPKRIQIEKLGFSMDDTKQPRVTIFLRAWAIGDSRFKSTMDVQTTVSSRYYQ